MDIIDVISGTFIKGQGHDDTTFKTVVRYRLLFEIPYDFSGLCAIY